MASKRRRGGAPGDDEQLAEIAQNTYRSMLLLQNIESLHHSQIAKTILLVFDARALNINNHDRFFSVAQSTVGAYVKPFLDVPLPPNFWNEIIRIAHTNNSTSQFLAIRRLRFVRTSAHVRNAGAEELRFCLGNADQSVIPSVNFYRWPSSGQQACNSRATFQSIFTLQPTELVLSGDPTRGNEGVTSMKGLNSVWANSTASRPQVQVLGVTSNTLFKAWNIQTDTQTQEGITALATMFQSIAANNAAANLGQLDAFFKPATSAQEYFDSSRAMYCQLDFPDLIEPTTQLLYTSETTVNQTGDRSQSGTTAGLYRLDCHDSNMLVYEWCEGDKSSASSITKYPIKGNAFSMGAGIANGSRFHQDQRLQSFNDLSGAMRSTMSSNPTSIPSSYIRVGLSNYTGSLCHPALLDFSIEIELDIIML
jgi:hypothetical protein